MTVQGPQFGAAAFHCPHCHAYAHQHWHAFYAIQLSTAPKPVIAALQQLAAIGQVVSDPKPEIHPVEGMHRAKSVTRLNASRCVSCGHVSLWVSDELIYPPTRSGELPHRDMPPEIRRDYEEARTILGHSPRGAAALLRLCIQKLCTLLGETGKDINTNIGILVAKGLPANLQMAFDAVRVIGNNAVHPGELDIKDDIATAEALCKLVNIIVEKMISEPKLISGIYDSLPDRAKEQVARRDKTKNGSEPEEN